MKTLKAVYPGSFDPFTLGHMDIIQRLQPFFDEIVVLIAQSSEKKCLFSDQERKALALEALKKFKNVKVDVHSGLTVDYLKQYGARVIIRGLRAVSDYEYELSMANMNKRLYPEVETMIIFSRPEYNYLASRMVKEVAFHGGDIKGLVPPNIEKALIKKISKRRS